MRKEALIVAIALILLTTLASANTAPIIQELRSEILICEGSALSYSFSVTDAEDGEMTLGISPDSPFFIRSTPSNTATTSAEIFSNNLTKDQANKKYPLTVHVSDEAGLIDTKEVSITVLERNNPPLVSHIGVRTILLTENFTEQLFVEDIESGSNLLNFSFNVSSDFTASNLSVTDLGFIQVVPAREDLGVHTVTACVIDHGVEGLEEKIGFCSSEVIESATCQEFQIAIVEVNTPPTILLYNSSFNKSTLNLGTEPITFEVYKFDPEEIIPETQWYVNKVLTKISTGSAEDKFVYTFGCEASGRHTVEAVVTDGALNDSVSWNLEIARSQCTSDVPLQPLLGDLECEELWGCNDWNVCQNLEQSAVIGLLSSEDKQNIESDCSSMNLLLAECGFQTRSCSDSHSCGLQSEKPVEIQACKFISEPSCLDNVQDCHDGSCEFLVDCGGPCGACATCSDGIKNQDEEGPDCGGPCFEECPVRVISDSEKSVKRYVLYAVLIMIVVSLVQISMIIHQKKKLEQPSKRGVKDATSNS